MEQQAATYLFQQAPAVVICIAVAGLCMFAIRALFRDAKEERAAAAAAATKAQEDCRAERAQDRAQWTTTLSEHRTVLAGMTTALQENTRATDRLTDRIALAPAPAQGRAA